MKSSVHIGALLAAVALSVAACSSSGGSSSPTSSAGGSTVQSSTAGSSSASGSATGSAPTGTPYVIGAPSQLSGPNKSTYAGLSMTFTAWQDSVNAAGGINGHPVKVVVKDTAGNAAQGLSVTKSLVQDDHAMAIIDSDPSIEQAILPYLTQNKIPGINALALYPFWTTTPGLYALGIPYAPEGFSATLKILQNAKLTSLSSIVCAEVAACTAPGQIFGGAAPQFGIKYNGTLTVSASAASYTAQCLQLKSQGSAAVFMGVSLAVSQKLIAACDAQGYKPTYFFADQSFSPALASISGIKALGISPVQLWYSTAPAVTSYTAAVKQYGDPTLSDMPSMFVWTALEAFKAAATANASAAPSAAAITTGFGSLASFDAGGLMASKVTFAAGKPSPKITCYFVAKIDGGKLVQDSTAPSCLS